MKKFTGFTTKQVRQERNADFSFANECREQNRRSAGFTLIEALIAITIVTFAITGPLLSAHRSIISAQDSNLQLTASHLAQEGIEHVRAMRDNYYLEAYRDSFTDPAIDPATVGWAAFLASIASCGTSCTLDPTKPMGVGSSLESCASCQALYLDPTTKVYSQSTLSPKTPFTRTIQVISVSPNEARIVSKVSWSFHAPDSITITNRLTPWQ